MPAHLPASPSCPQGIIKHLRKVLTRHPPPAPTEAAIRLVEAVGKLQNFVHRHRYAEANSRLNNRDIFGRFVLEWISSSAAQLSLRCRRLEQGAAGQHGWQEFASDGEWAVGREWKGSGLPGYLSSGRLCMLPGHSA